VGHLVAEQLAVDVLPVPPLHRVECEQPGDEGWLTRPDERTIAYYQGCASETTRANIRFWIRKARLAYGPLNGFLHVQSDAWTSKKVESFLSVGIQFIVPATDEQVFQRCQYNLGVRAFPGKHTGENIAAKMAEILAEYGIHGHNAPAGEVLSSTVNVHELEDMLEEDGGDNDDSSGDDSGDEGGRD